MKAQNQDQNTKTKKPLRVLIVEDSDDDALLILQQLRSGGYSLKFSHVDDENKFRLELKNGEWDVIISDFSLPQFSGLRALEILKETGRDIPFFLVSGTIGEDIAVEAMKAGAQDYVMKDNFRRLVPALGRELSDYQRRKRDMEIMRQSQKMDAIGQLAGGLAHDFNNILGVISLLAESIQLSPDISDKVRQHAQDILEAQQRGASLVHQLLVFGRQKSSHQEIRDLNEVILHMEKMLHLALGKQNALVLRLDPELPLVRLDLNQFEQVLMNLIINARDALAEKSGSVTLQTRIENEMVCLRVADTGCGMDAATREKIFEPFFSTKEFGKGTGLGLSTVFGIISQHGGKVYVESEIGHGTSFDIFLPIADGLEVGIF